MTHVFLVHAICLRLSLFRRQMKNTLVIGIGSILRKDDGAGIYVIDELEKRKFSKSIRLESADVSGLDLVKYFLGFERVIVVDAVDMKQPPAKVKVFKFSEIKRDYFKEAVSTHGCSLLETLALAEQMGIVSEIIIAGIQPKDVSFGMGLSAEVKEKIPYAAEKIEKILFS